MTERWIINKLGLINFWYYDEEEFELSGGKLLLRGANGSGKSVTMQSFIPLLLDGNKRPERIDPFGTTARKIENYLLMKDDENEKTAYLYMEFKKKDSEMYITIGMGLKAVRGKNVDAWYFIITDGRRVKKDFLLYNDHGYEKVPLTKKELKNRIGDGGFYTEEQGEYKRKVNEYLFGYSDIENYDELIDLLINIRSPKLSKDFKPTVIYEILENSLTQLTEDDLRPMSEAMENMDNLKVRIEELENCGKALKQIDGYYLKYNKFMLHEKAKQYIDEFHKLKELNQEKLQLDSHLSNITLQKNQKKDESEKFTDELNAAESKIKEYMKSDVKETKEKLENVIKQIDELSMQKKIKLKSLDDKKNSERKKEESKNKTNDEIYEAQKNKDNILEEMDSLAFECAFKSHDIFRDDFNINTIKEAMSKHKARIKNGRDILSRYESKKNDFEDLLQKKDEKAKDVESADGKLKEAEEYMTTIKEEQAEKIKKWNENNKELVLNDELLQSTIRSIMEFDDYSKLLKIKQPCNDYFNNRKGELIAKSKEEKSKIGSLKQNAEDVVLEVKKLKEMKEIDFERSSEVLENRKRLESMGIPFIPLYKAVDFKDNVKDDIKKNIESAMYDMGIIDALIIPQNYKEAVLKSENSMCDKYLFSEPVFLSYGISEYLEVDKSESGKVGYEDVDNVLKSILLDKNKSAYIDERGNYSLGILNGKANENYEPKFIGAASRERHRQKQIEELNLKISSIEEKINREQNILESINEKIKNLDKEYSAFPKNDDLENALDLINEAVAKLKSEERDLDAVKRKFEELQNEMAELKKQVYEAVEGIEIEKTSTAYDAAFDAAQDYESSVNRYDMADEKIKSKNDSLKIIEEDIEEIKEDIDNILYDLGKCSEKLKDNENLKNTYDEILSKLGYADIKNEIEECYKIKNINPGKIKKTNYEIIRLDENMKLDSIKIEEKLSRIENEKKLLNILEEIFYEEYNLSYVDKYDAKDTSKLCGEVLNETQDLSNKSKEAYGNDLYESYSKNSGILRDYQPKVITIFERKIENDEYADVYLSAERKDIGFRLNGKEVIFNDLNKIISEQIEDNKILLSDKEKEFFKEILLKTISNKIRAKILHSRDWVTKMNTLMQSMNTTSSFKLTLKWIPKTAQNEAEISTKELMGILEKDADLVRDEDINNLSKHFSSKIKEILRDSEDKGDRKNYHTVIKEILDYRKWYEFKLYSQKEGEKVKELTNNAFFQLSGGEKAMAMYIPLFTAVYSRYDMADKKDCPRVVALDEAFAGVDEENIRDMFRILSEMKLDYIMNSQVLWGDYDTVTELAIDEIVRPENSETVSVLRYHWNGREKQFLV